MKKLDSLRAAITGAVAYLPENPDRLLVFVDEGVIESNASRAQSYVIRYVARIVLLDFAGSTFALMGDITEWAKRNQPDIVQNPDTRQNGITFEADVLNNGAVDLSIRVPLTENVVVKVAGDGTRSYASVDDSAPGNADVDSAVWLLDPVETILQARRR
ncbi:phage tail protein [Burkholderia pyrrocinia]|uniref:Phage tail protein n=1 Tax=Burkholderia pyrrocinia TaxID=60550 RepID=A0A2Z5N3H7_BURPY|nr:phage tail protein [Burkholderia pyrrocinia]AXF23498.1 phage tail protein [Burkholderia pyrrocinia]